MNFIKKLLRKIKRRSITKVNFQELINIKMVRIEGDLDHQKMMLSTIMKNQKSMNEKMNELLYRSKKR